ncbi:toxin-antitoxin system protein [Pseudoroseomonas cervicalis]|uniref:toxin-antitoxin system protein n=1 Tax=Teichococcus cervicalis TaxID=204525 RepID=UPI0022F16E5D|nr:toxin-antitoxin system protein [Pseudoroseomonas cervicalis]WBV42196.1 toxin-antitoxin system protein [Pseudoroseomonas cervicalis]
MTPENWTPLLRALEAYPEMRARMAEPGLTLEQRVALLRQAWFDVSPQELLQWRTAPPEAEAGSPQAGGVPAGTALDEAQLDGIAGGWQLGDTSWRQPVAPGPAADFDDTATITL